MCCIAMAGQTTLNKKQCYYGLSINSFQDEDFKKNILFLVNTTIDDWFKKWAGWNINNHENDERKTIEFCCVYFKKADISHFITDWKKKHS